MEPVDHRDLRGDRADRSGRDRIDRRLFLVPLVPELVHPFTELDRSSSRSENHSDPAPALEIELARRDLRIGEGLGGRRENHGNRSRDVFELLGIDPLTRVEVDDFAGDAGGEAGCIEERDPSHARAPGPYGLEVGLATDAVRTDGADSADDDSPVDVHEQIASMTLSVSSSVSKK